MADSTPMGAVERLLDDAGAAIAYPPAPALRASVLAAIAERAPATAAMRPRRLRLAYVAAALLAALAVTLAVEPARTAVAEFFGLVAGEHIEIIPPDATPALPPAPVALADIADQTTLAAAAGSLRFEPALPPGQGEPRAVYLLRYGGGVIVVLEYERFDLWQSRSQVISIGKGVPADLLIDTPMVGERPSYWIEGGRHFMHFRDADGEVIAGSERAVDRDALVWRSGETFYRLETDLPLAEALAIAESLP